MPDESEQIWWLSTCRHVLARLAPRTSASFFWWSKEPGNAYTTFYPTHWLPEPTAAPRADATEGARLMERVVRPMGPPMRLTFGTYGDGTYEMPRWHGGEDTSRVAYGVAPSAAAEALCRTLNVEWLAAQSPPHEPSSQLVLAWLDRVLDQARRCPNAELSMDFEKNRLPMALWMISVRDPATGTSTDVWWPDREDLEWRY